MAKREPKRDRVVGMFDRGAQEKRIEKILDRAVSQRLKQIQRALVKSRNRRGEIAKSMGKKAGRNIRKTLVEALKSSLSRQGPGDTGSSRPSVRQTSKDGSRSFHFQYYSVSKKDGFGSSASGGSVKGRDGAGAASAHHAYIEREAALEAMYEPEGLGVASSRTDRTFSEELELKDAEEWFLKEGVGVDLGASRAKEGRNREAGGLEHDGERPGQAKAAQAYIENPVKLRNGEVILNSFGTIGETFQERMRFWDLLELHETQGNARVQNRIICELPHQSTPQARNEILREFVKPWEEKGIPYHVAVHAPGPDNDSRNFHAHIVFSERPAKRMPHPETGEPEWDFAIATTYKTKSRNTKTSHPHRQNKLREFGEKGFVVGERKRFAESVTRVMASVDPSVKFDHRSYKAMGIDVTPMKTVSRILKDRMRQGRTTVLDAAWTKRMIDMELTTLAQNRDADLKRMLRIAAHVDALKKDFPSIGRVNRRLSPKDRVGPLHALTRRTFDALMDKRLEVEAERVERRIAARAEEAVCRRVIAATNPTKTAATLRDEDPLVLAARASSTAGLDGEGVAALHQAAQLELAEIRREVAATDTRLNGLAAANRETWRKAAGAISTLITPNARPEPDVAERPVIRPVLQTPRPAREEPKHGPIGPRPPRTETRAEAPSREAGIKTGPTAPGTATPPPEAPKKTAGKPPPASPPRTPTPEAPKAAPSVDNDDVERRREPYVHVDGRIIYPTIAAQRLSEAIAAMIPKGFHGKAFLKELSERYGFVASEVDPNQASPIEPAAKPKPAQDRAANKNVEPGQDQAPADARAPDGGTPTGPKLSPDGSTAPRRADKAAGRGASAQAGGAQPLEACERSADEARKDVSRGAGSEPVTPIATTGRATGAAPDGARRQLTAAAKDQPPIVAGWSPEPVRAPTAFTRDAVSAAPQSERPVQVEMSTPGPTFDRDATRRPTMDAIAPAGRQAPPVVADAALPSLTPSPTIATILKVASLRDGDPTTDRTIVEGEVTGTLAAIGGRIATLSRAGRMATAVPRSVNRLAMLTPDRRPTLTLVLPPVRVLQ